MTLHGSAALRPMSKTDLVADVYETIREAILNGDLPAGEALTQESLSARLNVSRQPVSHALALLRHDGLVEDRGRRGLQVAPIDPSFLADLYEVRASIDRLAAERCAERANEKMILQLEADLAEGDRAMASGTLSDLIAADTRFHESLHSLSGNSAMTTATAPLWFHFRRSMGAVLIDPPYRERAWVEHRAIVEAILTRDPKEAGRLAEAHASAAGQATKKRLEASLQSVDIGGTP